MKFKECYVSKNGISCITNINTLHNFNLIDSKNFFREKVITYLLIRGIEFIITDFFKNYKHINDETVIQSFVFY